MIINEKKKHLVGHIVGFLIFVILIPLIIYFISNIENSFFQLSIINSIILRFVIVTLLFAIGLIFTIWSVIALFIKGIGGPTDVYIIEICPQKKQLVVTCPYNITRNPMIFGINSIYIAIAFFVNSAASLIFCSAILLIIILYLKLTEEKRLLNEFGAVYSEYKKRVSLLIPFLKRNSYNLQSVRKNH